MEIEPLSSRFQRTAARIKDHLLGRPVNIEHVNVINVSDSDIDQNGARHAGALLVMTAARAKEKDLWHVYSVLYTDFGDIFTLRTKFKVHAENVPLDKAMEEIEKISPRTKATNIAKKARSGSV